MIAQLLNTVKFLIAICNALPNMVRPATCILKMEYLVIKIMTSDRIPSYANAWNRDVLTTVVCD